jgi:hypothetical protein
MDGSRFDIRSTKPAPKIPPNTEARIRLMMKDEMGMDLISGFGCLESMDRFPDGIISS